MYSCAPFGSASAKCREITDDLRGKNTSGRCRALGCNCRRRGSWTYNFTAQNFYIVDFTILRTMVCLVTKANSLVVVSVSAIHFFGRIACFQQEFIHWFPCDPIRPDADSYPTFTRCMIVEGQTKLVDKMEMF